MVDLSRAIDRENLDDTLHAALTTEIAKCELGYLPFEKFEVVGNDKYK